MSAEFFDLCPSVRAKDINHWPLCLDIETGRRANRIEPTDSSIELYGDRWLFARWAGSRKGLLIPPKRDVILSAQLGDRITFTVEEEREDRSLLRGRSTYYATVAEITATVSGRGTDRKEKMDSLSGSTVVFHEEWRYLILEDFAIAGCDREEDLVDECSYDDY